METELEKYKKKVVELVESKEELIKNMKQKLCEEEKTKEELFVMTQNLETARSQIDKQQQNQMKLIDEKLTFIKEM